MRARAHVCKMNGSLTFDSYLETIERCRHDYNLYETCYFLVRVLDEIQLLVPH